MTHRGPQAFAAAASTVLDALPDSAFVMLEIGDEAPWLAVQPLAAEADRELRARGLAEVRAVLALGRRTRRKLDLVVGERCATLYASEAGALSGAQINIRLGGMSAEGGEYAGADEAAHATLRALGLDPDAAQPREPDGWERERPGSWSRNGRKRSGVRRFGPPRDEGAWARRLGEIRAEREATP